MKIIKCDKCKREITNDYNYIDFKYTFGYGTEYDGIEISCQLCEECLIKILEKEKIEFEQINQILKDLKKFKSKQPNQRIKKDKNGFIDCSPVGRNFGNYYTNYHIYCIQFKNN